MRILCRHSRWTLSPTMRTRTWRPGARVSGTTARRPSFPRPPSALLDIRPAFMPTATPGRNMMHQAGPFAAPFTQDWDSFNGITGVSTGPGNSGGPVFVTNEAALTDTDQGLRFAAVLVGGLEVSLGDSVDEAGVVAATASEWDLVNDALDAIGWAPINDSWSAALKIFGSSVTETSNNQRATREPDEPSHAGSIGGHSVWWRWVAPGDGPVAVNTTGSSFDTLLAVYTGNSVGALSAVAANDDSGGTTSTLTFNAVTGTEYWIAVDGKNGATGSIALNLNFTPPAPVNDSFANATTISGVSVQVVGHNINATKEPGEPNHAGSVGGRSVWWKWTAPASGTAFLTTSGTKFDTVVGVYTGTSVAALATVASDDDPEGTYDDTSALTFTATSGSTYWIAADGYSDGIQPAESGAILFLTLNLTPGAPVIVVQPVGQAVSLGDSAALMVVARGAPPLSYQWKKDGADIAGANVRSTQGQPIPRFGRGSYNRGGEQRSRQHHLCCGRLDRHQQYCDPFSADEPDRLSRRHSQLCGRRLRPRGAELPMEKRRVNLADGNGIVGQWARI